MISQIIGGTEQDLSGENQIMNMLGEIEMTSTATSPHPLGSAFIYGGQLVKATAAIAQSGPITLGTNCQATTVAELLKDYNNYVNANLSNITLTGTTAPVGGINNGEYFINNVGQFNIATADIAGGAAVTSSNSDITTIGEELTELNNKFAIENITSSVTVNTSVVDSYAAFTVYKYGNIVVVSLINFVVKNAGNNQTILTGLPKGAIGFQSSVCSWIDSVSSVIKISSGSSALQADIYSESLKSFAGTFMYLSMS